MKLLLRQRRTVLAAIEKGRPLLHELLEKVRCAAFGLRIVCWHVGRGPDEPSPGTDVVATSEGEVLV